MSHLHNAYDPANFRQNAHRVVDFLADYLETSRAGSGPLLPPVNPAQEYQHWQSMMESSNQKAADLSGFLEEFVRHSIHLHHPHYVGHQVCAPAPAAALAGLVGELLNNGMAIYEMGPAATALEHWIIRQTCEALGLRNGEGFLTSGGTLGTLTALLAARGKMLGEEALESGTNREWAVIASEEAHYCTARAAQTMGWGSDGLILVPGDDRFKMRTDLLPAALKEAARRGRRVIAVVASVCSTSTGSYDDLQAIADFCATHRLWLHADGAHGAAVAFCPELRHKIAGIERADSVILDYHKLLLTPALATAVLFREPSSSWAAFQQKARYLFLENEPEAWRDSGRRTMECTKLSMSLKIAALWQAHGTELFAEHLRTVHDLASRFAERLRSRPGFELAVEPESNIVCFRLRPQGLAEDAVDALNAAARQRIVQSGEYYLVQTSLRGRTWLRTALMNPFTTPEMLEALLDRIGTP